MGEVRKKLGRGLGILYRLKKSHFTEKTLISVYHAIFQSHLMYGITVWGYAPEKSINSLQVLQNKAIRIIGSLRKDTNINSFCIKNSILKISELHRLEMYKIMRNYEQDNLPNCFNGKFTYVR